MHPKRELKYPHAQKIISLYPTVPSHRKGQTELIKLRGYEYLSGRKISDCEDKQVYSVACRILNDCYHITEGRSLIQATLDQSCANNYEQQLYRTFNVPLDDSDPNYIPLAELEQMLLD